MGRKHKHKHKENKVVLTYERLVELEQELAALKNVTRKELKKQINASRETDNEAYVEAKLEQRRTESRISEIESILKHASVILDDDIAPETIILGSIVLVHDVEYDEQIQYSIVKSEDANSMIYRISEDSPLGNALLGHSVGDVVTLDTPMGVSRYKILDILGIVDGYLKKHKKKSENITTGPQQSKIVIETRDILQKEFITRVNVFHCTNEEHKLVDIRCRINVLLPSGKTETCIIPGACCETCDKYFILDADFQQVRQKGILLCKVVEYDFWTSQGAKDSFWGLNKESLLHIMGYNVNVQSDLSQAQRWRLLELIVDEGIMTVTEIRSHLQWLIKKNRNNRNFVDACKKWEQDSNHIAEYRIKQDDVVEVDSITKKNYRSKL